MEPFIYNPYKNSIAVYKMNQSITVTRLLQLLTLMPTIITHFFQEKGNDATPNQVQFSFQCGKLGTPY